MNTSFMLLALYDGKPLLDIEVVRRDYFSELSLNTFKRRLQNGDIRLPYVQLNPTQKGQLTISLTELSKYIDERREVSLREYGKKL